MQDGELALPELVGLGEVGVELGDVDEAGIQLRDGHGSLIGSRQC